MKGHLIFAISLLLGAAINAREPALPAGLDSGNHDDATEEPSLPSGLGGTEESGAAAEPSLPSGLGAGADDTGRETPSPEDEVPETTFVKHLLNTTNLTGFSEARLGTRTQPDPYHDDMSIGELRLQVDASRPVGPAYVNLTVDFLYDHEHQDHDIDIEEGDGWLDLRAANVLFTPVYFMDVKVGRQTLTWGTGDLVFINDLFPKDWISFFIGRDDEYLKAPSDAVKISLFSDSLPNLDIVYTPRFDSDRHVEGSRLSFYNPLFGRKTGEDNVISVDKPDAWFEDDEIALRLFENVHGYELAAYYYRGYWKSPAGINPLTGRFTFPELSVYGASIRGTIFAGIGYLEAGYYDSRQDRDGDNPFADNSEVRFLAGYEQELARNLTGTFQYYIEHMLDHDAYLGALPPGFPARDETRHTVTARLRKELMQEKLILSIFARYSPTDNDAYLRPTISYEVSDNLSATLGGNIFMGHEETTFLAQFEKNTSIYAALRYSY